MIFFNRKLMLGMFITTVIVGLFLLISPTDFCAFASIFTGGLAMLIFYVYVITDDKFEGL